MKLSEKIYYCRKRIGKSQEALAQMLGVSRQAVSKWETGDAEPEISKLQLLSQVFGVTVDWLLSEDEPEQNEFQQPQTAPVQNYPDWLDSLPGFIGSLFKKYGWLFGVYIAAGGAGIALLGGAAKYISNKMFASFAQSPFGDFGGFPGGTVIYDEFGNSVGGMDSMISNFAANNPVSLLGTFIMWLGIIMVIAGIVLAVILKKQSKK